jgi:hypothetical protein
MAMVMGARCTARARATRTERALAFGELNQEHGPFLPIHLTRTCRSIGRACHETLGRPDRCHVVPDMLGPTP